MRTDLFMYFFFLGNYIGTQVEVCRQLKTFLPRRHPPPPRPTPLVYATYRSKAVVPVLFLFFILSVCAFVI